jgi:hypothetical protein
LKSRHARVVGAIVVLASLGRAARGVAQDSSAAKIVLPPFELHGFLQVYYRDGDPTTKDGFRLRKADLKFNGELSPRLAWRVTFDASKVLTVNKANERGTDSLALSDVSIDQRTRILQDAALTYTINHAFSLDIGQQVIPLSLEGTIPTSQVETIERSLFIVERSRATGLGDIRDIGVSANGRTLTAVEYHVGVFNETGYDAGSTDANDQKAVIGRLVIHPPGLPDLQVGGSGAFEGGAISQRRERAGGEVQFRTDLFTLRSEAMSALDGTLRRFGWYGMGAVRPTSRLQLVARYDDWDRDLSAEASINNATERQVVVGGSYLLDGSSKFALNVVRQTFPNISSVRAGTIILVAYQAVW